MMKLEEEICCILRICCGGHHEAKAKAALAAKMRRELGARSSNVDDVAAWVIDTFDLAPPGSLKELRDTTVALAREYPEYTK